MHHIPNLLSGILLAQCCKSSPTSLFIPRVHVDRVSQDGLKFGIIGLIDIAYFQLLGSFPLAGEDS